MKTVQCGMVIQIVLWINIIKLQVMTSVVCFTLLSISKMMVNTLKIVGL